MAPQSGKAWSALGFQWHLNGDPEQAASATGRWRSSPTYGAILAAYDTCWPTIVCMPEHRALTLCPKLRAGAVLIHVVTNASGGNVTN
jgi:hypothetical protein